ncbi:MAG: hypothetical protein SGILL_006486 [Bacillariaceae sp.]
MTAARPRRKNGLAPPYTAAQLSTWVFLPILVLEFLFFVSPILPLAASIPCTLLFCLFAFTSTFYAYMAMKVDPKDPRVPSEINGGDVCTAVVDPEEPTKQCWICDIQVGEKSMHWLNTCVGKANYHFFFRCMISIAIMLVIQATIQIALILDIYLGNGNTKQRAEEWFKADATIAVVIVMGIFIFCNLAALSLIGQLLLFHLKLQRKGLSTYQFIVQDNQRRRERARENEELQMRRTMAVAHAKTEGKGCYALQLQMGGFCREKCQLACCDPLSLKNDDENIAAEKAPQNGASNDNTASAANGHAPTTVSNGTTMSGPLDGDNDGGSSSDGDEV